MRKSVKVVAMFVMAGLVSTAAVVFFAAYWRFSSNMPVWVFVLDQALIYLPPFGAFGYALWALRPDDEGTRR